MSADSSANRWFYQSNGKKQGPVSAADLLQLIKDHVVSGDTLVWRHGMESWTPASEAADLGVPAIATAAARPRGGENSAHRKTVALSLVALVLIGMLASLLRPKPMPPAHEPSSLSEQLIAIGRTGDLNAMPTVIAAITNTDSDVAATALTIAEGMLGMRYGDTDRSDPQTLAQKIQADWVVTQQHLKRRQAGKEMLLP